MYTIRDFHCPMNYFRSNAIQLNEWLDSQFPVDPTNSQQKSKPKILHSSIPYFFFRKTVLNSIAQTVFDTHFFAWKKYTEFLCTRAFIRMDLINRAAQLAVIRGNGFSRGLSLSPTTRAPFLLENVPPLSDARDVLCPTEKRRALSSAFFFSSRHRRLRNAIA